MTGEFAFEADYVIAGGGSAGCVLAARLSEDPGVEVVLLEAGGEATNFMVQLPVGFARLLLDERYDWKYWQQPDSSINDRRFIWSAGRLLGGGSSVNGQVYIRGTRADFDYWEEDGATGWGFDSVIRYFQKSETWEGPAAPYRGTSGPMSVAPMRDPHPLSRTFLDGCSELGLPILSDYNGGEMEGAYLTQTNQRNGWRCSTEKAYLRKARRRKNLRVVTHAPAKSLVIEDGAARGVVFTNGGREQIARARKEVIVSCGTMGSPALLMRSGIGPADHLKQCGIEVVRDVPEVGRNLHEHPCVTQNRVVNQPTINSQVGFSELGLSMAKFLWNRRGNLGSPAVQAMALVRTMDGLSEPDAQVHFMPLAYDVDKDTVSSADAEMPAEPCMSLNISLTRPAARGRVELGDSREPVIHHRLLGDERDLNTMVSGLKWAQRLFRTKAMNSVAERDRVPAPVPQNDSEWVEYARAMTIVAYHPVGTCRMGSDEHAVVDPSCRLQGIDRLRVVDASIMPRVTSANTNAAAIMIGEKAAELIVGTP